jgi:hypothetical protein
MTETIYKGDEDGPIETDGEVIEMVEDNCIWINGLTPAQFEGLREALAPAGKPLGRFNRIVLRLAMTMVFVAGCLWLVAFLVSNLPTR